MCLDYDTVEEISDLQNEAIVQFLSGGTGTDGGLDEGLDDYLEEQEQFGAAYPTTEIPYEIIGDQKMVRNLEIFVPPMNGRPYLPVVSQSMTGACYAFSATHAIGSQYAQVNPGEYRIVPIWTALMISNASQDRLTVEPEPGEVFRTLLLIGLLRMVLR